MPNEIMNGTVIGYIPEEERESIFEEWTNLVLLEATLWTLTKNIEVPIDILLNKRLEIEESRDVLWKRLRNYISTPTFTRYNCLLNGDIYVMKNEEFPYKKRNAEEQTKMKNIYDNKPKDGTIIGKVTDEELLKLKEHHIKFTALDQLSNHVQGRVNAKEFLELYKMVEEMERNRMEVWLPIQKRLNASFEWGLSVDYTNNNVYVENHDLPYNDDSYEDLSDDE